jgi:hypothetical protein
MRQTLRIFLFGTLLLGAFLLAGSLGSQAFAATTTASTHSSTPSFSRPGPDIQNYNRGYRDGFIQGYKAGIRACAEHHYRGYQQPGSFLHLTAYTRGYAAGYADGYNKGLHSCSDYIYSHHDSDNHESHTPDILNSNK